MKFEEILPALRRGEIVRREVFQSGLVLFMQIPAEISAQDVLKMKSVPIQMKILMKDYEAGITYHDQFMIYDFSDQSCTYYPFDGEDINADDWKLVDLISYDPYDDFR